MNLFSQIQTEAVQRLFFDQEMYLVLAISAVLLISYFALAKGVARLIVGINAAKEADRDPEFIYDLNETKTHINQVKVAVFAVFNILFWGYLVWRMVEETSMQGHVIEWLNLVIRWAHVIAGISWIGASFYFIFLENSLNRTEKLRSGIAGDLWAIHGGGFYFLEKFSVAPPKLPPVLHWFKYEAYFTWITGFALLWVVYYFNAEAYMIDPMVLELSSVEAVAIGVGSLLVAWLFYDLLCRSPLIHKKGMFGVVLFVFTVLAAWGLSELLSARAAYIHVGSMLGTIMVGNVFFTIIPSQKSLVKAATLNQNQRQQHSTGNR